MVSCDMRGIDSRIEYLAIISAIPEEAASNEGIMSLVDSEVDSLRQYHEFGKDPTPFVKNCLVCDFAAAEKLGSSEDRLLWLKVIWAFGSFIKTTMHSDSWGKGAQSKIKSWIKIGGLSGRVFARDKADKSPTLFDV